MKMLGHLLSICSPAFQLRGTLNPTRSAAYAVLADGSPCCPPLLVGTQRALPWISVGVRGCTWRKPRLWGPVLCFLSKRGAGKPAGVGAAGGGGAWSLPGTCP